MNDRVRRRDTSTTGVTVIASPASEEAGGPPHHSGAGTAAVARRRRRLVAGITASTVILLVIIALSIALGSKTIPLSTVWSALVDNDGSGDHLVVSELRIPRTILGVFVGSALALAGALMQSLTRNPLADPGVLGVNAGAALAVVVSISFFGVTSLTAYVWFAMLGAGLTTIFVYLLGSAGHAGASPVRLALAGTAVSAAFFGIISAIVLLDLDAFDGFRRWSVGSLAGRDSGVAWQVMPFILIGLAVVLAMAGPLNALSLGDDKARALGANVGWIRLSGVLAVTLLAGAATAAVGPIGFVGLVVPHMVRSFTGPDHRWLLPYSLVIGPVLLLGSDIVGRLLIRPAEVEVAVVTAVVGAPIFIMLVRRRRLTKL